MEYKDYYKIMGLSATASDAEIKRAYRKLARKYHPDVSKETDAEEKFKEIGEAYEVLKDNKKRKQYDELRQYQNYKARSRPDSGVHHNVVDEEEFANFFNSIFQQRASRRDNDFNQGVKDIHARLEISLEDSFHGAEKSFELQVPDIDSQGRTINKSKVIKVAIPKGITNKQQIRLKGQGSNLFGSPGDLYLEIAIKAHPIFHYKHKDILLELPILPWEAVLGATVSVPTLGGSVRLKIPKMSQSGKKLRLKGRGLPGNPPGDQIVSLTIVIPEKENESTTSLYEKLAEKEQFNPRQALGVNDD